MCYVCLTLVTPWTVARQAPLSMGFSRKEYWSGLSCPPPGDLPDPGIEHRSPALQAASLPTEPPGKLRLCAMLLLLLSRFSHVRLCVTPWTAVHQAPPSMGFSRQEYWSGLPLPSLAMCYRWVQFDNTWSYFSCHFCWSYCCFFPCNENFKIYFQQFQMYTIQYC